MTAGCLKIFHPEHFSNVPDYGKERPRNHGGESHKAQKRNWMHYNLLTNPHHSNTFSKQVKMSLRSKIIWIFIVITALLAALAFYVIKKEQESYEQITNFYDCAAAGYPILESYPEQCRIPDGRSFTRDIGNELEKIDLIRITNPRPGQSIISPLTITGEARGNWFFEASFPIELRDGKSNIIVQSFATAAGEWMTEEFVPFEASLTFSRPEMPAGTLILRKDNPSGLPEHDDALIIPVAFE